MTKVPLDGMPFTVTKTMAGPGWKMLALGGICEVWTTIDPSLLTVYDVFNWRYR